MLAAALFALPAAPRAQGAEGTRRDDPLQEMLRRGFELRLQHRDEEAVALFARGYALLGSRVALAQQGLAEQALGRWVDAAAHLRVALEGPSDPWVARHAGELRGALDEVRGHLASLLVVGSPAGARVLVDGHDVGALPMGAPVLVPAGELRLEVRAEGHAPAVRAVDARPRLELREEVSLARLAAVGPEPASALAPTPTPPPASAAPGVHNPSPLAHPGPWVLVGAGAALVGAGAAFFALQAGAERALLEEARCAFDGATRAYLCPESLAPTARGLHERASLDYALGVAGVTLGAASIAAGALWIGLRFARPERPVAPRPALYPTLYPTLGGAACALHF